MLRGIVAFLALLAIATAAAIAAALDEPGATRRTVLISVPAVALVLGLGLAYLVRRQMRRAFAEPVESFTFALESVANGDFGRTVLVDGSAELVDASAAAQAAVRRIARETAEMASFWVTMRLWSSSSMRSSFSVSSSVSLKTGMPVQMLRTSAISSSSTSLRMSISPDFQACSRRRRSSSAACSASSASRASRSDLGIW